MFAILIFETATISPIFVKYIGNVRIVNRLSCKTEVCHVESSVRLKLIKVINKTGKLYVKK